MLKLFVAESISSLDREDYPLVSLIFGLFDITSFMIFYLVVDIPFTINLVEGSRSGLLPFFLCCDVHFFMYSVILKRLSFLKKSPVIPGLIASNSGF